MKNFTAGAWRWANNGARADHMAAANDLVARTLAQHGLSASLPSMQTSGFGAKPNAPKRGQPGMQHDTYRCAAGTRAFKTYVPDLRGEPARGLVVMLHGCTQNADDFAAGTGMNAQADAHGFIVVYPEQSRGDNAQTCWNWFRRGDQIRDRGEPAILAGLTRQVALEHGVGPEVTFVAGLSAGAAMALILGETYGDVFAAVGAHSGLPYGAAHDVPSAFGAMAGNGVQQASFPVRATAPRTIVFHGSADKTVHPSNAAHIAQAVQGRADGLTVEATTQHAQAAKTATCTRLVTQEGRALLETWRVDGLGHAWSGGQAHGSYTDPQGPDASAEMVRFFFETVSTPALNGAT